MKKLFIFCTLHLAFCTINAQFIGGRNDFRDESIYFVITTRFFDGDNSNNVHCWDGNNPGDPAWRGDFKGLADKLDYIKALGFTAIWITPVVENASGYDYHGYHAMNFDKIDERYESYNFNFQDLINAVHAKNMKIIVDIVLNHSGNFGETSLCPMFEKQGNLGSISCMTIPSNSQLPSNYNSLSAGNQYSARLALMKNTDGVNHDTHNYWHHFGNFSWETIGEFWAQIAGDCVDLNTENPTVYNYLIACYTKMINMGVDGFRIDTGKHIARVTFNKVFIPRLKAAAETAGKPNFFMFAEVCARVRGAWNHDIAALSAPFYTWKETTNYAWSEDATPYNNIAIFENNFNTTAASLTNQNSCIQMYNANSGTSGQPSSNNHLLNGNNYRPLNYTQKSDLNVIDFPMHRNFAVAADAFNCNSFDNTYADATWNVVYVDSHDYAPEPDESVRFNRDENVWAENLSLMFTFRGIPCLYYGSETQFKRGKVIDNGPNTPLINTGRAYYGGYITGSADVMDFATYTNATGNMAVTLKHPLALHLQRLNKIRQAVPALRKGQYSTANISKSGVAAFKRRYTDANTDSYVLVTISGGATFNNIPNGTYTDVVTGDVKTVSNGTLTASCSGNGNFRAYVLSTSLTPAPGKVGTDGKYIYGSSSVTVPQGNYDGQQEALTDDPQCEDCGEPGEETPDPCLESNDEKVIFFEKPNDWGSNVQIYIYANETPLFGDWNNCPAMTHVQGNLYKYNYSGSINAWKVLFHAGSQQCPGSGQPGWDVQNHAFYKNTGFVSLINQTCEEIAANIQNSIENQIITFTGNNAFHFYSNATNITAVRIYDLSGKFIYGENCNSNALLINNIHFADAVYIVMIYTNKGIVQRKIVK
ncbi:MAG: starch-binding protein [Bacteroidales bacterium]|jgi:glycosidase|nr:starch-binding protein [Bacteroidales bacterium]